MSGVLYILQKLYICLFVHTKALQGHTNLYIYNTDIARYFPLKLRISVTRETKL